MQGKMEAVMGLGDVLAGPLRRIDHDGLEADPLDDLDDHALGILRLAEIGHRRLQHAVVGEVGRADVPEPRADLVAVGFRVAAEELRLFELDHGAMHGGPGQVQFARDVHDAAGRACQIFEHREGPRHAAELARRRGGSGLARRLPRGRCRTPLPGVRAPAAGRLMGSPDLVHARSAASGACSYAIIPIHAMDTDRSELARRPKAETP